MAFADRPVAEGDLRSLFEAARWAASSYNEQPWSYLLATKEDPADFARLLSCSWRPNQAWAKAAPVLVLGIVSLRSPRTARTIGPLSTNLGLASGNLVVEATSPISRSTR